MILGWLGEFMERTALAADFEQTSDGIVDTDSESQITFVSPAFTAITGYSNLDAVGTSAHFLSVTSSTLRNSVGEITSISIILSDLSARPLTKEASALQALLLESADAAIHAITLDGTIVTWNHGAELLTGYAAGEVVGQNVDILVPERLKDDLKLQLRIIVRRKRRPAI